MNIDYVEIVNFFNNKSKIKNYVLVDCRKKKDFYIRGLKSLSFIKGNS